VSIHLKVLRTPGRKRIQATATRRQTYGRSRCRACSCAQNSSADLPCTCLGTTDRDWTRL